MKLPIAPEPLMQALTISPLDLAEQVTAYYQNGLPRGDSPGWPTLAAHYTVLPGQWTLVTGIPGHGKSEFLDALMVNLALRSKWKFAVFSPENQPHEIHLAKLLEKVIRKPFGQGPNERMDAAEIRASMAWLDGSFRFIKPHPELQAPSIRAVIDAASRAINAIDKEEGRTNKYGIVIDPWNELEHERPRHLSETEYISATLAYVRQYAREWGVHIFIVAHPRILHRDKEGRRPVPTPYDVSGSAHWFNKADNCLTVWRDTNTELQEIAREDKDIVAIHVQKVRFKNIGTPGTVRLRYDRVTGLYAEAKPHLAYENKDE